MYLNLDTWDGLPKWSSEETKRAVFRSINNALTTKVLQLVTPVIVATQLQLNIRDFHDEHTIFLRAMPRFQGIVAQDCVKVLIDEDNDDGTSKKACTLENAWRFCKTQRENNSWSSNGLPGMRIMGLTRSPKYRLLNWPQRDTQNHSVPCLLTPL